MAHVEYAHVEQFFFIISIFSLLPFRPSPKELIRDYHLTFLLITILFKAAPILISHDPKNGLKVPQHSFDRFSSVKEDLSTEHDKVRGVDMV